MAEKSLIVADKQDALALLKENGQEASFIERIRKQLKRYQRLTGDERIQFLTHVHKTKANDQLRWYTHNLYPILITNIESQSFFGYDPEEGALTSEILGQCMTKLGVHPLEVVTHAFQIVIEKYWALKADLTDYCKEKGDSKIGFPFRITKQHNFSVTSLGGGGETVSFGRDYIYSIVRALLSGDEELFKQAMACLESQFFHELLHQLSNEDNLDNKTTEEMTLLGEFLYDPENNQQRNAIFAQMSNFALNEADAVKAGKWLEAYDRP